MLDLSKKTLNDLVNEKLNNMKDQLIELNNTLLYKKQLYFFKYYMKLNKEDIDYLFDTEVKETTIRDNNTQLNFENILSFLKVDSKKALEWCKKNLESVKSNSKISNKTTADRIEKQAEDNLLIVYKHFVKKYVITYMNTYYSITAIDSNAIKYIGQN